MNDNNCLDIILHLLYFYMDILLFIFTRCLNGKFFISIKKFKYEKMTTQMSNVVAFLNLNKKKKKKKKKKPYMWISNKIFLAYLSPKSYMYILFHFLFFFFLGINPFIKCLKNLYLILS